jgi:galactonate dehydratase
VQARTVRRGRAEWLVLAVGRVYDPTGRSGREAALRITAIETVRMAERPNLLWLLVHTDEGVSGLGETFFGAETVEAHVHEWIAPRVIGRDPLAIDALARDLVGYLGFRSAGAETRGNSAFDIALWDLWGRATGQPVAQLLGGFTRRAIRTYNTCAGSDYIRRATGQTTANWGLDAASGLDDLDAFLHRADELALSLLEEGITAMKIWPFDAAAERTRGLDISADELRTALEPFEKIRAAAGDRMEIMVEFHSLWQLLPAMRIARALAPYATYWHEDPIRMDSLASLRRYAEISPAPVCASETLASRWAFRDLLETGAAGIVMLDLSWCGGLSEARKIAAMAEAWHLPVAPHDCTGPVVLTASTHLSLNAPNALVQESVRAFYRGWYRDVVTALPEVRDGMITVPPGPGLGLDLHPDLDRAFTVTRRVTDAAAV